MSDAETSRYAQSMNEMLQGDLSIGVIRQMPKDVGGLFSSEAEDALQTASSARPRWVKVITKTNRLPNYVKNCPQSCKCHCHHTAGYPMMLNFRRVFKRLFPSIVEDPVLVRRCSELSCHATQASGRRLFIVVHSAFVSRAIVVAAIGRGLKLKLQVKSYPVVPQIAPIVLYAQTGDTDNIRRLIQAKQASVNDISEDGWSILHVRTCRLYETHF
jgi:hypothetical protein